MDEIAGPTARSPSPAPSPGRYRLPRQLALILSWGAVVGAASGVLAFAGGANVPRAVLTGGGGFATAVLLVLALFGYASNARQNDRGTGG